MALHPLRTPVAPVARAATARLIAASPPAPATVPIGSSIGSKAASIPGVVAIISAARRPAPLVSALITRIIRAAAPAAATPSAAVPATASAILKAAAGTGPGPVLIRVHLHDGARPRLRASCDSRAALKLHCLAKLLEQKSLPKSCSDGPPQKFWVRQGRASGDKETLSSGPTSLMPGYLPKAGTARSDCYRSQAASASSVLAASTESPSCLPWPASDSKSYLDLVERGPDVNLATATGDGSHTVYPCNCRLAADSHAGVDYSGRAGGKRAAGRGADKESTRVSSPLQQQGSHSKCVKCTAKRNSPHALGPYLPRQCLPTLAGCSAPNTPAQLQRTPSRFCLVMNNVVRCRAAQGPL